MAKPLRILHTNMHRRWGGQPNRVLTTAIGLRDRGHHVCIAGPRGAILTERASAAGIETFEDLHLIRGFRPRQFTQDLVRLRQLLRTQRFDIVDTHGSQDTWTTVLAVKTVGSPRPRLVRTRHNTFAVARHPMNRWLYRQFDHVITISPQVIPLMAGLLPEERFTAIHSAPDPGRFADEVPRDEVRSEFGFGEDEKIIGVVARLAPEKGHHVLLRAMPEVLRTHPRAKVVLVGEGRSERALEDLAAELGISERVTLLGFREDVPRLLRAFDLFVLPPVAGESLGTSILEAFLTECPVVATDVGGVRESVRDRETGLLIEPDDPKALAAAIIEQLSDPERGRAWARAGRALVESRFTPEGIAEQTERVYRRVLGL